jgi:valyl-tRNA synthetase
MEARVQGHDIIRTWLFYTIVHAHCHQDTLPWRRVVVSGWGLNEQGKRISKRDLDPNNPVRFHAYDPYSVLTRHGADSLRHWAARSTLGQDVRYSERDVKAGRKVVIKLWNIARFCQPHLAHGDDSAPAPTEDRWILHRMTELTRAATTALDEFDYASARQAADDLLWDFADDWLELAKHRIRYPQRHSSEAIHGARLTMTTVLRRLLTLYAPFLPFVTDELHATLYGAADGAASIHLTRWPETPDDVQRVDEVELVLAVLRTARSLRTERRISQSQEVETLIVDCTETLKPMIRALEPSLLAAARAPELSLGQADHATSYEGLSIDLVDATDP